MPGLTRQNSNAEAASQDKRLQLAIAKAELLALKKDLQLKEAAKKQQQEDNDFSTKHSAVIKHIKLKHIAIQWINNTYDIIAMKQQRTLKETRMGTVHLPSCDTRPLPCSESRTGGTRLSLEAGVQDLRQRRMVHTMTQSHHQHRPQKNKKGKVFSFGEEIEVAQREGPSSREGSSYGRI